MAFFPFASRMSVLMHRTVPFCGRTCNASTKYLGKFSLVSGVFKERIELSTFWNSCWAVTVHAGGDNLPFLHVGLEPEVAISNFGNIHSKLHGVLRALAGRDAGYISSHHRHPNWSELPGYIMNGSIYSRLDVGAISYGSFARPYGSESRKVPTAGEGEYPIERRLGEPHDKANNSQGWRWQRNVPGWRHVVGTGLPVKRMELKENSLESVAYAIATGTLAGSALRDRVIAASYPVDVKTLNMLLHRLRTLKSWQGAIQAREDFLHAGVKEDSRILTSLISIMGDSGHWREIGRLFELALLKGELTQSLGNATIIAFGKAGKWELAVQTFVDMWDWGLQPNIHTYQSLIRAGSSCGRWQECHKLLDEMVAAGFQPTCHTFTDIIIACGKAAQTDAALAILARMVKEGYYNNLVTYTSAISACHAEGRWEDALALLTAMQKAKIRPDIVTWTAAISVCAAAGQATTALTLLDKMKESGIKPTVMTWQNIIMAYCHPDSRSLSGAEEIVQLMVENGTQPDKMAWSELIVIACLSGQQDKAFPMLESMRKQGMKLYERDWNRIVGLLLNSPSWREVPCLFEFMKKIGWFPSVVTQSIVINAFGSKGLWQESFQIFHQMVEAGIRPDQSACAGLVRILISNNQLEKALAFTADLEKVANIQPGSLVYCALLEGCRQLGQWEHASHILHQMQIAGCIPDNFTCRTLVRAYKKSGGYNSTLDELSHIHTIERLRSGTAKGRKTGSEMSDHFRL